MGLVGRDIASETASDGPNRAGVERVEECCMRCAPLCGSLFSHLFSPSDDPILKSEMMFGTTATLHDTTSYLRVSSGSNEFRSYMPEDGYWFRNG